MSIKEGMRVALNEIRETLIDSNKLYAKSIDEIRPDTDIASWSAPILAMPELLNDFMNQLVQRIVYTQVDLKLFNNPLKVLEGDRLPLGSIGQEIFINPAKGRKFNVDDFAGLLAKYEADVKVQYHHLNSDIQYPVTITRAKIKDAFVSWGDLEDFISGITQSLYNGAYIDRYNMTKGLVASAYAGNNVQVEVINAPNSEAYAKAFITKARTIFLNMQTPTSIYNAWNKVGGYGREIITWSNPEDIVFLLRNDIAGYIDVNVLASAFNIDKSILLGNIIYVNDFNEYDNQGDLVFDGSKIVGMIADKNWFKIKEQEVTMDEFYNANNRTWQMYLNDVRMYSYSLFANAVVFATEIPDVKATKIEFVDDTLVEVTEGQKVRRKVSLTPVNATSTVTFTSSDATVVKATKIDDRTVELEGMGTDADAVNITATTESILTDVLQAKCVAGT